jgi:hypothetical protein
MPRTRRPRISRHLRELMEDVAELDRVSAARWRAERLIKFDPYLTWYRASSGNLVRALADGGCVMVLDGPEGWYIIDDKGHTFAPCDNPLPPGARRHDNLVFFADEESARLAAHTLPGYWW